MNHKSITIELKSGELTLIETRPGTGKSTAAFSFFNKMCVEEGKTAIFFSLEWPKKLIYQDYPALNGCPSAIIDDTPGISIDQIIETCNQELNIGSFSAVFVDCLQLVSGYEDQLLPLDRNHFVLDKLRKLSEMYTIPTVVLSQKTLGRSLNEQSK